MRDVRPRSVTGRPHRRRQPQPPARGSRSSDSRHRRGPASSCRMASTDRPVVTGPVTTALTRPVARSAVARHDATTPLPAETAGHPPSVSGSMPCSTCSSRHPSSTASGGASSGSGGRGNGPRSVANTADRDARYARPAVGPDDESGDARRAPPPRSPRSARAATRRNTSELRIFRALPGRRRAARPAWAGSSPRATARSQDRRCERRCRCSGRRNRTRC